MGPNALACLAWHVLVTCLWAACMLGSESVYPVAAKCNMCGHNFLLCVHAQQPVPDVAPHRVPVQPVHWVVDNTQTL